jgi:hypothetical protein
MQSFKERQIDSLDLQENDSDACCLLEASNVQGVLNFVEAYDTDNAAPALVYTDDAVEAFVAPG